MALEGIHLYMSLNQVFNVDNSDKIGYYYGFGYALPLLVVLVTALLQYKSYGKVWKLSVNNSRSINRQIDSPYLKAIPIMAIVGWRLINTWYGVLLDPFLSSSSSTRHSLRQRCALFKFIDDAKVKVIRGCVTGPVGWSRRVFYCPCLG